MLVSLQGFEARRIDKQSAVIGLNLYRLLRGYVWLRSTIGPANYFLDLGRWDNIAHDLVNALTTWFADFLLVCSVLLNPETKQPTVYGVHPG